MQRDHKPLSLSVAIERLQQHLAQNGDADVEQLRIMDVIYGNEWMPEMSRRDELVRRVFLAKLEAGFPRESVFFDDVWPVVFAGFLRDKTANA